MDFFRDCECCIPVSRSDEDTTAKLEKEWAAKGPWECCRPWALLAGRSTDPPPLHQPTGPGHCCLLSMSSAPVWNVVWGWEWPALPSSEPPLSSGSSTHLAGLVPSPVLSAPWNSRSPDHTTSAQTSELPHSSDSSDHLKSSLLFNHGGNEAVPLWKLPPCPSPLELKHLVVVFSPVTKNASYNIHLTQPQNCKGHKALRAKFTPVFITSTLNSGHESWLLAWLPSDKNLCVYIKPSHQCGASEQFCFVLSEMLQYWGFPRFLILDMFRTAIWHQK